MNYTHAILGGTGHIGTALAHKLLEQQQSVLIIGHDPAKAKEWTGKGAAFETADILDSGRLLKLFRQAERLFILNPPAPPDSDTDAVERQQITSILKALEGLHPKKIVAASTYGARPGKHIYDLGTLYDLEQGLKKLEVPLAILRSAYYMSNFDQTLEIVKATGELNTPFPVGLRLPMVDPRDIGLFAAKLLNDDRTGLFYVAGPAPYTYTDAAAIFSELLGKPVKAVQIPEDQWKNFF